MRESSMYKTSISEMELAGLETEEGDALHRSRVAKQGWLDLHPNRQRILTPMILFR